MTTENLFLVITFATLGFYSTNIVTSVTANSDHDCVPLPQSCDILWNVTANATVFGQQDRIEQINSTLEAITETTVQDECLSSIRSLMCINISAIRACNNTNSSLVSPRGRKQQACTVVERNCTEMVAKMYGSMFCPEIHGYNNSECVNVTVASGGYCPYTDTYKIAAGNIKEFLRKASAERVAGRGNISNACLTEYKRMKCKTFASTCPETSDNTKESCEQKLQCLSSDAFFNKTRLCSNFPSEPTTTMPTTQVVTTPYDFTKGYNTTVTIRLKTRFNSNYANKSSSLYKSFVNEVTNGLKIAYKDVDGFQGVFIEKLTCHETVAVKHKVVTSSAPNVKVMEARLILANITMSGYLEGKVVEVNKACVDDDGDHDHHNTHTDSTNWVYMIVFVCITALLLLAMVLCHQSK